MDEKMTVEKGIIGTQYEEEEEEEERGGFRKRRRSKEDEEEEEREEEEEADTSVTKLDLPPGVENARSLKSTRSVWLIALEEMIVF